MTRSFLFRNNLKTFITARILRIYPALLFCSLLGLVISDFSVLKYINDAELSNFVFYNSTMVLSDAQELPGVFYDAPFNRSVNGSLWTLPWELRMYVVLAGLGVVLAIAQKIKLKVNMVPTLIISIAIISTLLYLSFHFNNYHHWFYVKFCRFLKSALVPYASSVAWGSLKKRIGNLTLVVKSWSKAHW